MSTPLVGCGFMLRQARRRAPPPGWQNGRMSAPDAPAPDDEREVLSSLPRSRRQRPTARREAARAKRARAASGTPATKPAAGKPAAGRAAAPKATAKATAKPAAKATAKPAAKATAKAAPKASATKAAVRPRPAKRAIPPAGYATPRTEGEHGSADPGAALAGLVRTVLRLIPRP